MGSKGVAIDGRGGEHTRLWFHDRGASHTRGSQWLDMAGEAGSKERDTKSNKRWLKNCKKMLSRPSVKERGKHCPTTSP